ncbi:zinc finger protein 385B [Tachysurus ichikawai]
MEIICEITVTRLQIEIKPHHTTASLLKLHVIYSSLSYLSFNQLLLGFHSNEFGAKLALQKDLVKPISPAFISSPFSSTTIPSISLHPRPNTSIFQTPALPASFLRGAPGPIRPSSSSILFAPY